MTEQLVRNLHDSLELSWNLHDSDGTTPSPGEPARLGRGGGHVRWPCKCDWTRRQKAIGRDEKKRLDETRKSDWTRRQKAIGRDGKKRLDETTRCRTSTDESKCLSSDETTRRNDAMSNLLGRGLPLDDKKVGRDDTTEQLKIGPKKIGRDDTISNLDGLRVVESEEASSTPSPGEEG